MIKNYYQILGLQFNASLEEIKKAYRIYATKYHPDKQHNDKFFEERFKEIKEAYDILSNDEKKATYDLNFDIETNKSSLKNTSSYSSSNSRSAFDEINRELEDKKRKADKKRKQIYYTTKEIVLNGLYVNSGGKSYMLSDYDGSTIRKDDNSNFIILGVLLIIIGIITIPFFVGPIFIVLGIYGFFYKDYFVVLIGREGDEALIKGRKAKMKKICTLINKAIKENKS
jgi:curved DNA-binding protein CbpA